MTTHTGLTPQYCTGELIALGPVASAGLFRHLSCSVAEEDPLLACLFLSEVSPELTLKGAEHVGLCMLRRMHDRR